MKKVPFSLRVCEHQNVLWNEPYSQGLCVHLVLRFWVDYAGRYLRKWHCCFKSKAMSTDMQITEPHLWAPQCCSCGVCIQSVMVSAWLLLLKLCPAWITWLFIKCNLFISLPVSPDCLPAFPCLLGPFPCACTTFAISVFPSSPCGTGLPLSPR